MGPRKLDSNQAPRPPFKLLTRTFDQFNSILLQVLSFEQMVVRKLFDATSPN